MRGRGLRWRSICVAHPCAAAQGSLRFPDAARMKADGSRFQGRAMPKPALSTASSSDAGNGRAGVEIYRQGWRMALIVTIGALILFTILTIYDPPRTGRLSLGTEIAMVAGTTAFVGLLSLFGAIQRIEIDRGRQVIRVANKDTGQRWLSFRIEDVVRIRRLDRYRTDALAMDLRPEPGRSRNVALVNNEILAINDHSGLFVALVTAVLAVDPEVELVGFSAASSDIFRRSHEHEGEA